MKTKHIFIASGLVIFGGIWLANKTNALTYQDTADVQFTFDPSLELELSGTSININNLMPGQAGETSTDGVLRVTVATNSVAGYKLSASVGNSTAPRNGTSLIHSTITSGNNSAAANKFTSLATDASVALTSISDGYWGYAISTNGGTSYSNYSGFGASMSAKDIQTKSTTSASGGDTVYFKIGAKAPANMLSGDYSNVINFQAVTNVVNN